MELQTARRRSFSLRPSRCSPPRPNQKARTLCRWDSQRNLLTGRNDHGSSLHAAEWGLCLLSPTPTTTATRSSTVRFLGKKNPDSSPAVSLRAPRQFLLDRPQLQASPCCQSFPCLFSFKIITPSFDVCFLALMTFLLGKSRWLSKGHPSSLRSRDCFLLFSTPIALFSSVDSQHGMCWLSPPFPLAEREPEQEKQGPVERCREGSHRIREACWAKTTMLPLGNSPPALLRTLCPGSLQLYGQVGPHLISWRAGLGDLYSPSPRSVCMDAVPTFWIRSAPPSSVYRVPRNSPPGLSAWGIGATSSIRAPHSGFSVSSPGYYKVHRRCSERLCWPGSA